MRYGYHYAAVEKLYAVEPLPRCPKCWHRPFDLRCARCGVESLFSSVPQDRPLRGNVSATLSWERDAK